MVFKIRFIILLIALVSCLPKYGKLTYITKLPDTMKEISGMQKISDDGLLWMINDNGNKDRLYGIDEKGIIKKQIKIIKAKNIDWEDLTKDDAGNLYIGDFGNNENERKDLTIYKIPNPDYIKGDEVKATKITFRYPEQKHFPPKNSKLFYDLEAFFFFNNNLYLFTKNASSKFDGTTFLYKIPAVEGDYEAQLLSSYKTCHDKVHCRITSADINPAKNKIVLLGHDKIWLLTGFTGENFYNGDVTTITLGHDSQKESICFIDNNTVLIADEGNKNSGRNLYSFKIRN